MGYARPPAAAPRPDMDQFQVLHPWIPRGGSAVLSGLYCFTAISTSLAPFQIQVAAGRWKCAGLALGDKAEEKGHLVKKGTQ